MRLFPRAILLIFAVLWTVCGTYGQQNLPAAVVFHTEEYSELGTWPAVCFENAWADTCGRLMILTCPPESADGMHMFAFDGYEFRAIRDPFDGLSDDSRILARADEYTFVCRSGINTILTANILTGEIRMLEIPDAVTIPVVHPFSGDSILIVTLTAKAIAMITWGPGGVYTSYIEIPASISAAPPQLWLNRNHLWCIFSQDTQVYRIDLHTRQTTPIGFEPALKQPDLNGIAKFIPFWTNDRSWILVSKSQTGTFYQLDNQRNIFTEVEGAAGAIEDCGVFEDLSGNFLVYFRQSEQPYSAVLYHSDGSSLDFSGILRADDDIDILSITGEDFTKEMLVCHRRGLRTIRVTGNEVIKKTLDGHSIRAMFEVEPGKLLVTTQQPDRFMVDTDDWDNPRPVDWACEFGRRKIIRLDSGLIAATAQMGLVVVDPASGECRDVISEVGGVVSVTRSGNRIAIVNTDLRLYEYDIAAVNIRPIGKDGEAIHVDRRIYDMAYSGHLLWIATSNGLWRVDSETGEYRVLGKDEPFQDYHFLCLREDQQGRLWLGSVLGGLQIYDPQSGNVTILDTRSGLPNNTVVTIQEDANGLFWVATHDGVALVNREGRLIRVFDELDGLADNESNRYAGLTTASGKVLVGSINGLSMIDPSKGPAADANGLQPVIYLTDIEYRQDDRVKVHMDRFGLPESPDEIVLPPEFRSIKARFALSDYVLASQNNYEWKFARQDEWRSLGTTNKLELDDIRPGRHVILIRGSNREGILSSNMIRIRLHVQRFFYQLWWFYVLCGLAVTSLVVAWIVRLRWAVSKATSIIAKDKKIIEEQADKLRELDEAKSKYFTEISHELRTPLTIISGMSAQILDDPGEWSEKGAALIRKNSQRMLKLVNQILDLRQLESSEIKFRMLHGNIVAFLSYLSGTYDEYTRIREIDFSFIPFQDSIPMDYDPERITDIVSNLVSNAIKFCQAGDQVRLEVETVFRGEDELCEIRVVDTGTGIAEEQIPHIFERFYRVRTENTDVEGSGVGLALVHELVQRLDGQIVVRSKLHEGTVFTVSLPIRHTSTIEHDVLYEELEHGITATAGPADGSLQSGISILVVEDNPDLVTYMHSILDGLYTVHTASDGLIGEHMAFDLLPDMIISDVMMPGQTGIELCVKVKNDRRSDHIPVILLTAKADQETRLESLEKGADAFLAKPFDRDELLITIANLTEQRRQLHQKFSSVQSGEEMTAQTDPFISGLDSVIDENMEDDEFSVVHLCRAMSMSRTNLHNKIKAITGRSTTGYIRYRRLMKARELLQQGNLNVSEVAYAVGFKSQSYFSTSYAREFGVSPSSAN